MGKDDLVPISRRKVVEDLLESGDVMVVLDARCKNVEVPDYLSGTCDLRLVLSYKFRHPINIDDEKIFTTLLFNKVPVDCVLPFDAIWGVFPVDKVGGGLWLDSIPAPIRETLPSSLFADTPSGEIPPEGATVLSLEKHPKLQIIQGGRKTPRSGFRRKPRSDYLRLVQGEKP